MKESYDDTEFSAMEELLAEDYQPPCNIYISSSHNEEIAGDGVPKALEYFKKQGITFEVMLDKGGTIIGPPVERMSAFIQEITRKNIYDITVEVKVLLQESDSTFY